ncbi:MAG TPA: lytic transglycosylase domain-containing protein [Stellaceae bacterium]|nr:lytic transglycosylase domain-containing protein [Stellaceae bacterium]
MAAFGLRLAALAVILGLPAFGAAAGGRPTAARQLDRIAYAVDGAESSHGRNPEMWRPDPAGPQGPMQVSAKAATDVGGGDRFDVTQNRAIGRAYLAQLYRRYGNWPDAIAAYNWGMGNLDKWIRAGRPPNRLVSAVAYYLHRVLHDSGLCNGATAGKNCGAQFLGNDMAAWRAVLAAAGSGGRAVPTLFDRTLARAALLAEHFGAEQSALERRLAATP